MTFFYIDICYTSSINEGHFVDTQFCIHNLIKEDDWNNHSYTQNSWLLTCINSFIAYHKKYFEILMVATVCPISKSDRWIERYRMIKFAWSACIVCR